MKNKARTRIFCLLLLAVGVRAQDAQSQADPAPAPEKPERWNIFWQATSIGQTHDNFHSPYAGPESLAGPAEAEASLTTTLFIGFRLGRIIQRCISILKS